MKGGNVNDFIDHTTFEECAVIYKGEKYFFHGLIFDKEKNEYSYTIDACDKNVNFARTVFNQTAVSAEKCMELAQNKPIFDGKSFWEAESEMEWVEW